MSHEMRRLGWMLGFSFGSFAFAWVVSNLGAVVGGPFALPGWMIVPYWGLSLLCGTFMGGRWAIQTEPFSPEAEVKDQ